MAIDLATGAVLQRLPVSTNELFGLTRDGSTLWVMDSAAILTGVSIATGGMVRTGSVSTGSPGNGNLFAAAGIVYAGVGTGLGYTTVDVRVPATPVVLAAAARTGVFGVAVVLNGAGQGVAIGNLGLKVLQVVDTRDPTNTSALLTQFTLPGAPSGIAIGAGVAYVADGTSGLQVVNYKAIDISGVGPTITILSGPGSTPGATAATLSEGSLTGFTVQLSDPGQIRNVELLINGKTVVNDSAYPFELAAALPSISGNGSPTVTLAVRATDTAGHVSTTAPVTVTLTPDRTPPALLTVSVAPGSVHSSGFRTLTYRFSKPIDAASVIADNFGLVGPGSAVIAPVSVQSRAGGLVAVVTYPVLAAGSYSAAPNGAGITDRAGNALTGTITPVTFSIAPGNFSTAWAADTSGLWSFQGNWETLQVPGATDKVLLTPAAGITITHDKGTDQIAGLTQRSGTLDLKGGTLAVAGTLAMEGGTLLLKQSATLKGATVVLGAGTIEFGTAYYDAPTLDGVTWTGDLAFSARTLYVANGIHVFGGSVRLTAGLTNPVMSFVDDQIVSGVNFVTGGGLRPGVNVTLNAVTGHVLTLGATTTLTAIAGVTNLSAINNGQIAIGDGATLVVDQATFRNTGRIAFAAGSTLQLDAVNNLDLSGLGVTTGTGGTLSLANGTIDLANKTLDPAKLLAGADALNLNNLTLKNGTLNPAGNATVTGYSQWSNLAVNGTLTVSGSNLSIDAQPFVTSGLTLNMAALPYSGIQLNFTGTHTLDHTAIHFLPAAGGDTVAVVYTGTSLTLGADSSLDTRSSTAGGLVSGTFVNAGTITTAANTFSFSGESFTNSGTLAITGGRTTIDAKGFASSGSVTVSAGATLQVNTATGVSNTGTLSVAKGGTLEFDKDLNLASLGTAGGGGSLMVYGNVDLGGRTFDLGAAGGFGSVGLQHYGGTISNGTLHVGNGALSIAGKTTLNNVVLTEQGNAIISTASLAAAGAAMANADGTVTLGQDNGTTVFLGPNASYAHGYSGSAPTRVFIYGNQDTITVDNTFTSDPTLAAQIYNFRPTKGDVLDVSQFLAGTQWDHQSSTLSGYLTYGTSGDDITIYGNGGRTYFGQTALATLHNEPGITLGTLQASGAIKLV